MPPSDGDGSGTGVSFRQVGKTVSGTVHRGGLSGQKAGSKNFSSIPSKFETTLFTGNKGREGFGTRAHRFTETEHDLPGPGTYAAHEVLTRDDRVYSKKGLGVGFVSKSRRAVPIGGRADAPGPGQYEQHNATLERNLREIGRHNASATTSSFKPKTQRSVVVAEDPPPGPGSYSSRGTFDQAAAAAAAVAKPTAAAASSGSARRPTVAQPTAAQLQAKQMLKLAANTPAPGQYDPRQPEATHYDALLPSPAFRSTVPVAATWSRKPSRLTMEQALGVVSVATGPPPGPGSYDTSSSFPQSKRRMPQFIDSGVDRFGRSEASVSRAGPGPGAYYREEAKEKAPISSAAFMSNTTREAPTSSLTGVPGPAFYKPTADAKKSYHLNAVQRWMPVS